MVGVEPSHEPPDAGPFARPPDAVLLALRPPEADLLALRPPPGTGVEWSPGPSAALCEGRCDARLLSLVGLIRISQFFAAVASAADAPTTADDDTALALALAAFAVGLEHGLMTLCGCGTTDGATGVAGEEL